MIQFLLLLFLALPAWGADSYNSPLRSVAWAQLDDAARIAALFGAIVIPAVMLCLLAAGGRKERRLGVAMTRALPLLLFALPAGAATYYVRPIAECPNNGDGTAYDCAASAGAAGPRSGPTGLSSAWQTANVASGDTIKLCGIFGQADAATVTSNRAFVPIFASGSDGSPIVIDGDCSSEGGLSKAYYRGDYTSGSIVRTEANAYLIFRNLDLAGAKDAGMTLYANAASEQATAKHIIVESTVTIHDIHGGAGNKNGITMSGTNITIGDYSTTGEKISIYDVGTDAINWYSSGNGLVDGARIWDISEDDLNGDCVHVARRVNGDRYLDVDCDKTNVASKQCIVSATLDAGHKTDANRVERLRCSMNGGADWASGGDEHGVYTENPMTVTQSEIWNPTSYGMVVGLRDDADLKAYGNIIVNPGEGCFAVRRTSASGTGTIENNTCLLESDSAQTSYGINAEDNTKAVVIKNNSISGPFDTGIYRGASGTVDDYNNVYGPITPHSDNGVTGSASTNDISADPQFIGGPSPTTAEGFKLNCLTSPLKDAGTPIAGIADYTGRLFVDLPEIGAYACQGGTPRTTLTPRTTFEARTPVARDTLEAR